MWRVALAALGAAMACGASPRRGRGASKRVQRHCRRLEGRGKYRKWNNGDRRFCSQPREHLATLETMHAFPGRLLLMFQPHGYGPRRSMKDALVDCFGKRTARTRTSSVMPKPVEFGGTVDRSVGSRGIVCEIERRGRKAFAFPDRKTCGDSLVKLGPSRRPYRHHGSRRDRFSQFARELLLRFETVKHQ